MNHLKTLMTLSLTQPGPEDPMLEPTPVEPAPTQPDPKPKKSRKTFLKAAVGVVIILGIVTALALTVFKNPTNYMIAGIYASMKDYEKAYSMYDALGDYEDSQTKALESTYHITVKLMEEGKFETSCPVFSVLNVLDSETVYKECMYQWGNALLSDDKLVYAFEKFDAIKGYKDTEALIQSTRYKIAGIFSEGEEYYTAAVNYGILEDYEDAEKLFYYNLYKHFEKETEALGYVYYDVIDMAELDLRVTLQEIRTSLVENNYGHDVIYDDLFWPIILLGKWTNNVGDYFEYHNEVGGGHLVFNLPFEEGKSYPHWIVYHDSIWLCNTDLTVCDEWININFISETIIEVVDPIDDKTYYLTKKP